MTWEYKVIRWPYRDFYEDWRESDEAETLMNQMGKDGWELVSVLDAGQNQNATISKIKATIIKNNL